MSTALFSTAPNDASAAADAESVSLETYASVTTGTSAGFSLDAVLANERVEPEPWSAASSRWSKRIAEAVANQDPLAERFDAALAVAQARYGRRIRPLDEDLARWIDFERHFASDSDPLALLARVGLDTGDVLRLHRAWSQRLADNPTLCEHGQAIRRQEVRPLVEITVEAPVLIAPARRPAMPVAKEADADSSDEPPSLFVPLPGWEIGASPLGSPKEDSHNPHTAPPTPSIPSYLVPADRMSAPIIRELPSQDINSTAELRAIPARPSLPFVDKPPSESIALKTAPEPKPLPSSRDARDETAALPAITRSKPSTPFVRIESPQASSTPKNVDATMEIRAISAAPAMPFVDKGTAAPATAAPPEPKSKPSNRDAGDETSALPAIRIAAATLPFGKGGAAAAPDVDSTTEVRAITASPALPFAAGASAQPIVSEGPKKPAPTRDERDETAALPAIINLKQITPFANPGEKPPEAPPDPGMLTLEQYASLSAELDAQQLPRPDILKRYGLQDESARTKQAIYWARRMQKNEPLKVRYTELMASFREHLERTRGG